MHAQIVDVKCVRLKNVCTYRESVGACMFLCVQLAPHSSHLFVVLNLAGGIIAAPTVNRQETLLWAQPAM